MDKTVYFSIPSGVTHGRGYIYSLQYHIVWVAKYRKPIFVDGIEEERFARNVVQRMQTMQSFGNSK